MPPKILVECLDISDFPCDVLVLKYAQEFYGADEEIAYRLKAASKIHPLPDQYVLLPSNGMIITPHVLFTGTVGLFSFDYGQIRKFASNSLKFLAEELPNTKHVAMTMHGVGYGLDEKESFLAQIAGLLDAFQDELVPESLEKITIVERNRGRVTRLKRLLSEQFPFEDSFTKKRSVNDNFRAIIDAGVESNTKLHIFVAMPFSEEMEDTYGFGIQGPVNAAGYLCERVDMATFTGDILDRIKSRIETAALVIADLTGANANVYLEVGYAWGKNKSTLLIARNAEELKFDVKGQRCIIYKNITDLANKLKKDVEELLSPATTR